MTTKSKTAPTSLTSLLRKNGLEPHQYVGARIALADINVLLQPRQTFEEIELLAEDIAAKNLMNPLIVARFCETGCRHYLSLINRLWATTYKTSDLIAIDEGKKAFYILLAGERRFRACLYLRDVGCEQCQEQFGKDSYCYERHFGDQSVEVRLCINIPPLEAVFIQASENIHMKLPAHEEATFYDQLFRLIRQMDPNYPLARFAKQVGRSPSTIRQAVKFCLLPAGVREFVENGQIPYGVACEIARLQQKAGLKESEIEWWALTAITDNLRVKKVRDMVTEFLRTYNSGQFSLISLLSVEEQQELERSHFRKVVERQAIQAIWMWIYYLKRVLTLFREEKLGQEDSPFSELSPVRVFRELLVQEELLLPHLWRFLPRKIRRQVAQITEEAKWVLSELRKKASA